MSGLHVLNKMKTLPITILAIAIFLTACSQPPPKAQDLLVQMQKISNQNNGEGFLEIIDLSVSDFYEKDGGYYAILDVKMQYLISKSNHIKRLKEKNGGSMLNDMKIDMLSAQLGNFEKGEIKEMKGEHVRLIKSENGWIIDL